MLLFGAGTASGTGLVLLADLDLGVDVTLLILLIPLPICCWSIDNAGHGVCSADAPRKRMSWLLSVMFIVGLQ